MTNPTTGRERFTYTGRYVIRTEWRGKALLYDIFTRQGLLIGAGFDRLSNSEDTAIEGIKRRLYRRGNEV